jgi:type II secretion system protein N
MNRWIRYLGYLGAGIFFFVFFLLWTFPYDVLKTRIVNQIQDGLGGDYRIKIQKMSAGILTGLSFKNIEVVKKEAGKELLLFKSPKLKLHPSLLALLQQNTDVSFSVQAGKGEMSGDYLDAPDQTRIRINFDELNLTDLKFISALYGLNLKGVLDGDFDVKLSKKDPTKNDGKIDLQLISLTLDPMKINLDPNSPESAMDLPKLTLTGSKNSKISAEMNKSDMEIKELSFKGGDVDLTLKGKLTLAPKLDDYKIDLQGRFKLNPQLSQAIPLLALFEQQKEVDGSYPLQLSGKFTKPSIMVGKFKLPF